MNEAGFPNMNAAKKGKIQFLTKEYLEKRCARPLIFSSPISLITTFMNTISIKTIGTMPVIQLINVFAPN
ncbi:hypothetical protein D3C74_459980 [compost metagenome]